MVIPAFCKWMNPYFLGYVKPGFDPQKKGPHLCTWAQWSWRVKVRVLSRILCTTLSLPTPLFLCTCIYIYIYLYIYIFRDGFINAINILTVSVTLQIHWHRKKRVATYQLRYVKAAKPTWGLVGYGSLATSLGRTRSYNTHKLTKNRKRIFWWPFV